MSSDIHSLIESFHQDSTSFKGDFGRQSSKVSTRGSISRAAADMSTQLDITNTSVTVEPDRFSSMNKMSVRSIPTKVDGLRQAPLKVKLQGSTIFKNARVQGDDSITRLSGSAARVGPIKAGKLKIKMSDVKLKDK